jgi:hypothetical protein
VQELTTAYPKSLRAKEIDLIEFVLPEGSPGYEEYRRLISGMVVLAEGRRGKGNFVLGRRGDIADVTSSLPSVIAYGIVETTLDAFSVSVRECVDDQIDVEIVSTRGEEIPDRFEEKRRWTYSTWRPGQPSPCTGNPVRPVKVSDTLTLAIAKQEKRLWLHDARTMMNHLIPITNFYNELMLHQGIRDPKVALKSDLLYEKLEQYTDADLRAAFVAYNKQRKRVDIALVEKPQRHDTGMKALFKKLFSTKA